MKKLINIAAVLLAASMIFVGCSNGVAAPGSNNGGSGSGNGGSGSGNGGSGSGNGGSGSAGGDAQVTPIECDMTAATWGWGYGATATNDSNGNLVITLTGNYGAGSFGYNGGKDLTGYTTLEVEIVSVTSDDPWYQIIVQTDGDHNVKKDAKGEGSNTVSVDLTGGTLDISNVVQVSIQGKNSGDVIVVKSVKFK